MKDLLPACAPFLLTLLVGPILIAADDPGVGAEVDAALRAVKTFEYGQDAGQLELLERKVLAASGDASRRAALEERILGVLREASTRDAKEFLCRQLRTIGSARSVPELEALLRDPELSGLARFALERVEDRAAGAALLRALPETSGKTRAGILSSLGQRRDRSAVAGVSQHLTATDTLVARAAAGALGVIGGTEAVAELTKARRGAAAALALEIDNSLLVAAERFLADGAAAEAALIYRTFLVADKPRHQRIGALNGLTAAGDAGALELLLAALRDPDIEIRLGAIDASRAPGRGPDGNDATTKALAEVLPSLAPDTQALLVQALASRPGKEAVAAVHAATASPEEAVRVAAHEALGRTGDATHVELLLRAGDNAAVVGEKAAAAARSSLLQLRGDDVDAALARLALAGELSPRLAAIRTLAARRAPSSFGRILPLASDETPSIRQEAAAALGLLAGAGELADLTAQILKAKESSDRLALESALSGTLQRLPVKERSAEIFLAPLRQATAEAKPNLVRLLGKVGAPAALEAVRARLADDHAGTRDAAVRTLAEWPDATPVEDLHRLASTLNDVASKEVALRGYIRLAGLSAETVEPYRRGLAIASRPEERAIVLEGLGAVPMTEALDLVEPALSDENALVRTAAARAAVAIADKIRGLDSARARATVEKAWSASQDEEVRRQGQAVIDQIEKFQGHLLAWAVAGPYREEGKDARAMFDEVLLPETPLAREAAWKRLRRGVGPWGVDLAQGLGPADNVAVFVRATVSSPSAREVRLELGSDDAIKVWLNGALVHANFVSRGLNVGDDRVTVQLQQGANDLLLKIVNVSGPWGFACRLRSNDGSLLRDLKVEPALRAPQEDGFVALFDGKSLEGWEQKGGKAIYRVEDGMIVGKTVPNTSNSFLCTSKLHGDFVLEYEFHCDEALNSGVQIRSNAYEAEKIYEVDGKKTTVPAGRVHGYQVEIDPNQPERAWAGGIYDEGRRGWLYPGSGGGDGKKFTAQGQRLYRKGEWNQVRVEAVGASIKTWLNGELRAELKDDLTPTGFIALQVHGVGGRTEPLEVRWRKLRLRAVPAGGK